MTEFDRLKREFLMQDYTPEAAEQAAQKLIDSAAEAKKDDAKKD